MKGTKCSVSFPFFFRKHCGHPCIPLGTKQAVINAISFDSIPTVDGCNGRYKAKLWSNRFSKFYGNITFPDNVVMKKKQKKQGIEMVSTTKRFLPVTNAAQDKQWWIQTIIECSSPNETFLHFVPNRKEGDYLYLYAMLLCQRNLQWIQKMFSLQFLNTWRIRANVHGHK